MLRTQAPTFESYQTAVDKALACIRRAGIDVIGDSVVRDSGYPEIAYSFAASSAGRSDEQTLALADACVAEHSRWVEEAYLTSPRVVEAKELQFDPYRSALTTCLAELGVELPTDATRGEILVAAAEAATTEGRDCIDEVGYAP
ncbi:hypothetical protein [uncultured Nocardioides sp.]|uniref:hypothetical protein n=1 Tax=uncultured Nocardioides sp. TaxID=198441 RepID=UPI0026179B89|nr:hypothetical protein [uncultured Nocardioides sp.]